MRVLKQMKYNGRFYKVGDRISSDDEAIPYLIKKGFVEGKTEPQQATTNNEADPYSYDNLTVSAIKLLLDEQGIAYTSNMNKEELYNLLKDG